MSFADQVAADMAFIVDRTESEHAEDVLFWASDEDPEEEPEAEAVRGLVFRGAQPRRDDDDGKLTKSTIIVQVTRASVSAIDAEGWVGVDGVVYVIESVSRDRATWIVRGCVDEPVAHGDARRAYR